MFHRSKLLFHSVFRSNHFQAANISILWHFQALGWEKHPKSEKKPQNRDFFPQIDHPKTEGVRSRDKKEPRAVACGCMLWASGGRYSVGANNYSPLQQSERSRGRMIIRPYSRANNPVPAEGGSPRRGAPTIFSDEKVAFRWWHGLQARASGNAHAGRVSARGAPTFTGVIVEVHTRGRANNYSPLQHSPKNT
jgi:hypothetical protein